MAERKNVNHLLNAITQLDESVTYETQVCSPQLKIRWINANMVQVLLPTGKTLITDPFFAEGLPGSAASFHIPVEITVNDFEACDYIFLNHAHPDHYLNIRELVDKFKPLVFVDAMYAHELSRTMGIELAYIFPVEVGHSYRFPDFRLDTYHGTHNPLTGIGFGNYSFTEKLFGVKGTEALDQYGSLFNTNFMLTFENGFRLGFAAGTDNLNQADFWKTCKPNLLLHQRMVYTKPEDYAEEVMMLGSQLVMPIHHETSYAHNANMKTFTDEVNALLQEKGAAVRMFNPQRMKWYTVHFGISLD